MKYGLSGCRYRIQPQLPFNGGLLRERLGRCAIQLLARLPPQRGRQALGNLQLERRLIWLLSCATPSAFIRTVQRHCALHAAVGRKMQAAH